MNYGRLYEHFPYCVRGTSREVSTWASYLLTFWEDDDPSSFAFMAEAGQRRLWLSEASLRRLRQAGEELGLPEVRTSPGSGPEGP